MSFNLTNVILTILIYSVFQQRKVFAIEGLFDLVEGNATEPEIKTNSYLRFLNNTEYLLRDTEDTFSNYARRLEEDTKKYTRLLEDLVSPDSVFSATENITPILKWIADDIHRVVRKLKDELTTFRTFEIVLRSDLNAIGSRFLKFVVNLNTDPDKIGQGQQTVPIWERTSPYFETGDMSLNQYNPPSYDNRDTLRTSDTYDTNRGYTKTESTEFLDTIRKTIRDMEDKLKNEVRKFDDNVWKFLRLMEDNVEGVRTSTSLPWSVTETLKTEETLKLSYTLKGLLLRRLISLSSSMLSGFSKIGVMAELTVSAKLLDGSKVMEIVDPIVGIEL